jgi:acetate kinase
MGGIDVLVFSGGVGERSPIVREKICDGLEFLGIYLDKAANESPEVEKRISRADSPVEVLVIPTDEEIVIARDTYNIVREHQAGELRYG